MCTVMPDVLNKFEPDKLCLEINPFLIIKFIRYLNFHCRSLRYF